MNNLIKEATAFHERLERESLPMDAKIVKQLIDEYQEMAQTLRSISAMIQEVEGPVADDSIDDGWCVCRRGEVGPDRDDWYVVNRSGVRPVYLYKGGLVGPLLFDRVFHDTEKGANAVLKRYRESKSNTGAPAAASRSNHLLRMFKTIKEYNKLPPHFLAEQSSCTCQWCELARELRDT